MTEKERESLGRYHGKRDPHQKKQKEYWEGQQKRRSPNHPVVSSFALPKVKFIMSQLPLSKMTILDVGCGNGFFTYPFSKYAKEVIGLDYSKWMLSMNPSERLVCGSALSLPFKDNSFDLVFCSNLLHHVKNPETVVKEMKRVSKKFIAVSEPNRNNPLMALFAMVVSEERSTLKFSLTYMEKLVLSMGLRVLDSCSLGFIAPNKTPLFLLDFLRKIDKKSPVGLYNIVLAQK